MRLTSLTLSGFKSFADETEFRFDSDIIGIVGPNGCGKSNIVDAIKWVLGTRSSKSLRGEEMSDVIFAGSAGRKPSGMAGVKLAFENPVVDAEAAMVELDFAAGDGSAEDPGEEGVRASRSRRGRNRRSLPIDTDFVEVERRLYLDGASHYLINGRRVRLRDIRELFLDTGIGADSYSIIEQGRVDAMLLANPQDLRTVFEEAAGVAKYKQRRIESQRKLAKTESNLLVTREQLQNTERRLRMVKGQASKAKRFLELDAERRALQLALAFQQYHAMRERLVELLAELEHVGARRDELARELDAAEQRKRESEMARQEAVEAVRSAQSGRAALAHEIQTLELRAEHAARALDESKRRLEADESRLALLQERLTSLIASVESQAGVVENLSARLRDAEARVEASSTSRAGVLEEQAARRAVLDDRRRTLSQLERDRAGLSATHDAELKRASSLEEQIARLDQRMERLASERASASARAGEFEGLVSRREEEIAQLESGASALDTQAEQLATGKAELASRFSDLEQQYLRCDSRRGALEELVAAREGLGDSAREVLRRRDERETPGASGVIAPLIDFLRVDARNAEGVEAALGPAVRALLVRTLSDVPSGAELSSLPGRVTFLSLFDLPGGATTADVDESVLLSGRVERLRGLVSVDAPDQTTRAAVSALLDRLLGSTLVVDSLEGAMLMRAAMARSTRFVTRDGTLVESDGRVTGGPLSGESGGMIRQRSELADLERRAQTMRVEVDALRSQLESVSSRFTEVSEARSALRSDASAKHRLLAGERAKLDSARHDGDRLAREVGLVESELVTLRRLLGDSAKAAQERSAKLDSLGRLRTEIEESMRAAESDCARLAELAERASDALTGAKVEAGASAEQLGAARRELRHSEASASDVERELAGVGEHLRREREATATHVSAIDDARRAIDAARGRQGEVESAVTASTEVLHAREEALTGVNTAYVETRRANAEVEGAWNNAEMARRELVIHIETLENRVRDELSIELMFEYPDYRGIAAELQHLEEDDSRAGIDVLRSEIRALGNVNLDSIEEEQTLEGRNEALITQVRDLDDARVRLEALIKELNEASRERFGEVFDQIRENFAGQGGMFRKLFGGGRAEVRLLPLVKEIDGEKVETDEIDLLESGVEIIAKPPGKEPQTIRQLSGGEKTLTVVALLLAIFRTKPSCFCILDEVDAALDEANVARYAGVLREFTPQSHFIVITHNKKTMRSMDELYGVTMAERGVSTRVNVRFDQVGEGGKITLDAGQGAKDEPRRLSGSAEISATYTVRAPELSMLSAETR